MPINVKNTTFPGLLDLLAPHSCRGCGRIGSVVCERCKNNLKCCNFDISEPIYVLGPREGLLDDLVHAYKYDSVRAIAKVFAELLDTKLPAFDRANTVIVPLPTSTAHIRSRGFDHTLYLAKRLKRLRGYKVASLLSRTKNTVQVGADEKTRKAQAEQAFEVRKNAQLDPNVTYIVLDDVWTTGASMQAAVKKLRRAGAKNVVVAVLAISKRATKPSLAQS